MRYTAHLARKKAEMDVITSLLVSFTEEMKKRIKEKHNEGYSGWDNPNENFDYLGRIKQAADEGRWVDAANLAMLKWNRESE